MIKLMLLLLPLFSLSALPQETRTAAKADCCCATCACTVCACDGSCGTSCSCEGCACSCCK